MGKIKVNLFIAAFALLILVDMWPVNKRYLNKEHFSPKRQASQPFNPTPANQFIHESTRIEQQGPEPHGIHLPGCIHLLFSSIDGGIPRG